ncbi:MAG TPA: photosynthetic complex putative assembly protein PuhB [Steroidobacteraceae bacterium]
MSAVEYDYEPIPGLPGALPADEVLLWQGSPKWQPLARRALRALPVAIYFGALALWQGCSALASQHAGRTLLQAAGIPLLLGASVVGLLVLIGWAAARATVYSITNQRVVIRHGIALPMSLNLPFKQIQSAALCMHRDGSGDISLVLPKAQRVGYLLTWPHVRPGHYVQPQPTLRGLADAPLAAQLLARALLDASGAAPLAAATPTVVRVEPSAAAKSSRAPVAA